MQNNQMTEFDNFCETSKKNISSIFSNLREIIDWKEKELKTQLDFIKEKSIIKLNKEVKIFNEKLDEAEALSKLFSFTCNLNDLSYFDTITYMHQKFNIFIKEFESNSNNNSPQISNLLIDFSIIDQIKNILLELNIEGYY